MEKQSLCKNKQKTNGKQIKKKNILIKLKRLQKQLKCKLKKTIQVKALIFKHLQQKPYKTTRRIHNRNSLISIRKPKRYNKVKIIWLLMKMIRKLSQLKRLNVRRRKSRKQKFSNKKPSSSRRKRRSKLCWRLSSQKTQKHNSKKNKINLRI